MLFCLPLLNSVLYMCFLSTWPGVPVIVEGTSCILTRKTTTPLWGGNSQVILFRLRTGYKAVCLYAQQTENWSDRQMSLWNCPLTSEHPLQTTSSAPTHSEWEYATKVKNRQKIGQRPAFSLWSVHLLPFNPTYCCYLRTMSPAMD